jgi:RNA polymerase sigma factor (sigma-70 family)
MIRRVEALLARASAEPLTDAELLRRFGADRDQGAFAELVLRHGPMVLGLARRVLRDHQRAEDVFQATFLVLARKARTIRGGAALPAWLHSVAFRIALRARPDQQTANLHGDRAAASPSPLDELSARELLTILDQELDALPEKYRAPLVLCYLEGLAQEEAARRLGLGAGAVKGRLERGRATLRRRLSQRGLGSGAALLALLPAEPAQAVPPTLAQTTIAAAATDHATPAAVALARGTLRAMSFARLRAVSVVLVLVGVLSGSAGWLVHAAANGRQEVAPEVAIPLDPTAAQPAQGVDLHGDPLPEGAVLRLGTVRLRSGTANLALSPDGKTLIGLRGGCVLTFWDAATGKLRETRELDTHTEWGSVLSADGRLVAAGYDDVEVWDVATGKLLRTLPAKDRVESRAISPDGKSVAAVVGRSNKYQVRVWDVATGKETFTQAVNSPGSNEFVPGSNEFVAFAPDGQRLVAAFASADVGTLCWDLSTGKQLWQDKQSGHHCPHPAFSADGGTLLSASPPLDVATGKHVDAARLPALEWGSQVLALPDGKTLLIGGADGVVVWDMKTGKEVRRLAGAGEEMALAADGKTLLTSNGALQRWDLATGKPQFADNFLDGHCQEVQALAFSADGQRLVSGAADGSVRLWDATTGKPLQVWRGHEARRPLRLHRWWRAGVQALDLSPDGRWVASAGSDERLCVWDAATGKQACTFNLPQPANGEHERVVYHVRIGAGGKSASAIFGAQGYTFSTIGPAPQITDWLATWELPAGTVTLKQALGEVRGRGSSLSRDGKTLASLPNIVRLPGPRDAVKLEKADDNNVSVLSPDGCLAAGDVTAVKDNMLGFGGIRVWEAVTGEPVALIKNTSWSGQLLFHPGGRHLAVNDLDGIHLFELETGREVWTRKLPERVRASTTPGTYSSCMAFTPDGKRLATGHTDGTILVWEVKLPAIKPLPLTAKEAEGLWADLGADAAKAWAALWRLTESPEGAVPLLAKHLKPVATAPAEEMAALLADLDSPTFAKREAASKRLKELGLAAEPALRAKLDAGPTLELRRRIEALLKDLAQAPELPTPESVRDLRAVAALGRIDSPEARKVLQRVAQGPPSARLTSAASAALGR